jgi:hypothetical protein
MYEDPDSDDGPFAVCWVSFFIFALLAAWGTAAYILWENICK